MSSLINKLVKNIDQEAKMRAEVKISTEKVSKIYADWKWEVKTKVSTPQQMEESMKVAIGRIQTEVPNGGIRLSATKGFEEMLRLWKEKGLHPAEAHPQGTADSSSIFVPQSTPPPSESQSSDGPARSETPAESSAGDSPQS